MVDKRRLRTGVRKTRVSSDGKHALKFGLGVGYWPCLRGPYVQLYAGTQT